MIDKYSVAMDVIYKRIDKCNSIQENYMKRLRKGFKSGFACENLLMRLKKNESELSVLTSIVDEIIGKVENEES